MEFPYKSLQDLYIILSSRYCGYTFAASGEWNFGVWCEIDRARGRERALCHLPS
jgi:hypothetical protein